MNPIPTSALTCLAAAVVWTFAAVSGCVSFSDSDIEADELDEPDEIVVLVHGLGRTHMSMTPMVGDLEERGYEVVNWGYSSTCCSVDELGERLAADLEQIETSGTKRIHFVGHSLGNIIVQSALESRPLDSTGRIVMLAPPNQGSETADRYVGVAGWFFEPLDDLTTDDDSTARRLSPTFDGWEVAVIAGEDDGKVSIEETRHGAEDEHRTVSSYHTFIMARPETREMTGQFLETGEF